MDTFKLEILSLERVFYSGECVSLVIPISDGMLGIMAHHTPLTAAIPDGEISFTKPDGEKVVCAVTSGMADVSEQRVRLLCKTAVSPDEIDEEAERRLADEAKMQLQKEQSLKNYKLWQLSYNKAANRLKIKNKDKNINM